MSESSQYRRIHWGLDKKVICPKLHARIYHQVDAFELWVEKTLESHLACKEVKPVNPKGNQSWIFIGRTDIEAEAPILWPPNVKTWLSRKDPGAGKDWRQEEKRTTRGWDGWIASPTLWTCVWVNLGSWWWIGKPGMLQFMGLPRVRDDWVTELNWT